VVLGNLLKAQLLAAPAGRIARVPTVWAKHDHFRDRELAAPLARMSTRVIGAVEEVAAPTRRADAVIIPPPRPDAEPAGREEARAHLLGLGVRLRDRPTLVIAGRVVPYKGIEDAIRALALPGAAAWDLVVAGTDAAASPGETERLRALAVELGVAERVVFAGLIDGVSHWLAAFDALAMLTKPTPEWPTGVEGFGSSAFEAALAGLPVVGAGAGAVGRRLQGGRAGIAVAPGDPAAVADALGRLSDPAVRAAMGSVARDAAARHPGVQECARMLVEVLRDAAATRPRARSRPGA
jgi:glycosyltransferase involved in cell wall biosynthesis